MPADQPPTSVGQYTIRPYAPADRAAFLDLFEDVFGDRMGVDWFAWKYEEDPYTDRVPIVLAESDGRIVGARSFLGLPVADGERTYAALQPCDTMVRADHRRRGLFARMTNAALDRYADDADLYFNFPDRRSLPENRRFGWRLVEERETFYRVQNPAAANPRARRLAAAVARGYLSLRRSLDGRNEPFRVEWRDEVPVGLLAGLAARNEPRRFHVRRDGRFYAWRFGNPRWRYRTAVAVRDGRAAAAVVVGESANGDGSTVVQLADVVPLAGGRRRERAVSALVSAVARRYADADLLVAPGGAVPDAVLSSHGFLGDARLPLSLVSSPSAFVARPATRADAALTNEDWTLGGADLRDPENWRLALCEVNGR